MLGKLWRLLLPSRMDAKAKADVTASIGDGAMAIRRFYVLLALSTIIASFGLLANSAAVIIGAMIVAPLMGPILGLSLGMVSGNHRLERDALLAEITGVALAIGLGVTIGYFPFNLGVSAEMLSRTSPTAYDLFVAVAAGLAGAYASVNPKINSAFAGVAISVALVPPLATSGLLISMGRPKEALGAFLLFLANFFSIQVASACVFVLFGFGRGQNGASRKPWRKVLRFAPGSVALLLMAWYLTGTLSGLVRDHQVDESVRNALSEQIARRTGGRLEQVLRRDEIGDSCYIVASALTPAVFQPDQVAQIEAALASVLGRRVRLVLRSIVSQDMNRDGRVYLTDEERQQSARSQDEAKYLELARTTISRGLDSVRGAWLTDLQRAQNAGTVVLTATVQGPSEISPTQVERLQDDLQRELDDPVHLIVRNVSTRDVDTAGYLYQPTNPTPPKPDPLLQRIRERLFTVLARRLSTKPAGFLQRVGVSRANGKIAASATVVATQPVRPEEVARIELDLQRYVSAAIILSVHTELASTASSSGWRPESGSERGPSR